MSDTNFESPSKLSISRMSSEPSLVNSLEPVPIKRFASDPGPSKPTPVSLSHADVDPELLKLQIEWADLLMDDSMIIDIPPACDLSPDKKQLLAGRWFDDGVVGWKIDYPQTEFELKCYRISRSRRFLQIYTLLFFLHLCSPFVIEPYCPWEYRKDNKQVDLFNTGQGQFLPPIAVNLFDLTCILVYLFDIVLRLVVNNGKNRVKRLPPYKDKWILIRIICTLALLADVLIFLGTGNPLRYARCLIPLVYIARRNSMRQMVHGLTLACRRSLGILSFLLFVHLFWSYLGFIIFRGVDVTEGDRFYDLPTTLLTVLQCVASRSFSILALTPYYDVNPTATLFFLALTIAADLICINLIVAVGNRQYKLFSSMLFKKQLRNRRQAFVAIHNLLANDRGYIARETWLGFCSNIQGKYSVKRAAAELLFSLECERSNDKPGFDCVDCVGFFRLSALLSARIDIDVGKVNTTTHVDVGGPTPGDGTGVLSEENVQARSVDVISSDTEIKQHGDNAWNPIHKDELKHINESPPADTLAPHIKTDECENLSGGIDAESSVKRSTSEPSLVQTKDTHKFPLLDDSQARSISIDTMNGLSSADSHSNKIRSELKDGPSLKLDYRSRTFQPEDETDINNIDEMELLSGSTNKENSYYVQMLYTLRLKTVKMIKFSIPLSQLLPPQIVSPQSSKVFCPYDFFFFAVKVALAVQLVFMSRRTHTLNWIRVGWFLEALLWAEMLLFMFAWGLMIYFRRGGFGYIFSLNIITLIAMISMGSNADETFSTSYFLLLIFQSCRYLVFFRYLADANLFISLVPLLMRVLFLIFCVIYFFAVIGHNRLCNVFNANNIDDNTDDDASIWLNFEEMFNFNSLLHTMYTLFYVAMLGNWTFIMDAAARTEKIPSLFYFYSFRLLMTLIVIPIMFAFIIQSYIAARDKQAKSTGTDEIRLSNHLRIIGTYQFEAPTPSAVGDEPISEATIDRALMKAESRRQLAMSHGGQSVSGDKSVTSYQMEGSSVHTPSSQTLKVRSEKDAIRKWNQGTLSVQEMFEAYASGLLLENEEDSETLRQASRGSTASESSVVSNGSVGKSDKSNMRRDKYQVKVGEKSASMMTFWSGGQSGVVEKAASEKDKKKAQILERMVEETLNQIVLEKENLARLDSEFAAMQATTIQSRRRSIN